MLGLLTLPIELLRLAFYALQGLVDALSARDRLRSEFTVLINASRRVAAQYCRSHRAGRAADAGDVIRTFT